VGNAEFVVGLGEVHEIPYTVGAPMAGVPRPQTPRLREVLAPQEQLGVAVKLRRSSLGEAVPEEEGAVTPAGTTGSLEPALGGLQHVAQVGAIES